MKPNAATKRKMDSLGIADSIFIIPVPPAHFVWLVLLDALKYPQILATSHCTKDFERLGTAIPPLDCVQGGDLYWEQRRFVQVNQKKESKEGWELQNVCHPSG